MLRGFSLGLVGYALSAIVFVVFSIVFVRVYGADTYGRFSILLNTVSALTLFGNYHGALVPFSAAVERVAFLRMLRPVIAYSIVTAAIAGAALAAIGDLPWNAGIPIAVAFVLIIVSGLPAASLMASASNWLLNVWRAIYQCILILGFWLLFEIGVELAAAFVLSLILAAALYLCLTASKISLSVAPTEAGPVPKGILLFTLGWNVAVMGIMLLDKAAIRFLNAGPTASDVGLFLLYFDIAGRLSAIYAIALAPFTYDLLQRSRQRGPIVRPISISVVGCLGVGLAGFVVGQFLIPLLYNILLGYNVWLPALTAAYLVLVGFSSVLLAYCNATGRFRFLLWHYVSILLAAASTIAAIYAIELSITVTQLAFALVLGHSLTALSALLVVRSRRAEQRTAASGGMLPVMAQATSKR